jgi:hypothetical protein
MDELNNKDWDNIIELLDMGANYDNDGCDYAANDEKNEHDIKLMNSYRKLKAALGR